MKDMTDEQICDALAWLAFVDIDRAEAGSRPMTEWESRVMAEYFWSQFE